MENELDELTNVKHRIKNEIDKPKKTNVTVEAKIMSLESELSDLLDEKKSWSMNSIVYANS